MFVAAAHDRFWPIADAPAGDSRGSFWGQSRRGHLEPPRTSIDYPVLNVVTFEQKPITDRRIYGPTDGCRRLCLSFGSVLVRLFCRYLSR